MLCCHCGLFSLELGTGDDHVLVCEKLPWTGSLAGVSQGLVSVTVQGWLGFWWQWAFPCLFWDQNSLHGLWGGAFSMCGKVCVLMRADCLSCWAHRASSSDPPLWQWETLTPNLLRLSDIASLFQEHGGFKQENWKLCLDPDVESILNEGLETQSSEKKRCLSPPYFSIPNSELKHN